MGEQLWRSSGWRRRRRSRRLVDPTYDFIRLRADGSLKGQVRRLRVAPRVRRVVLLLSDDARRLVEIDVPDDLSVFADPAAFDRIIANLVANALRYGEPPVRITAARSPDAVRIDCVDHGRGVGEAFVPRLFDRFSRSEHSAAQSDGSGLGLANARFYAQASGGDLLYLSPLGEGARFRLELPTPAGSPRWRDKVDLRAALARRPSGSLAFESPAH